ncbi:hypothetical protein [Helicobacter equorum]|uniref:hypothetical protein n=1 Tax=Helicobacter equorum TaxID=361872 RepID=UPI000CF16200|nr:hypothetical protein [Helicobacter equorum]
MATAIENEKYAVIDNNKVVQIFTKKEMPEWDENTLQVVKIPMNKEDYVLYGTEYKNGAFVYENLESLKIKHKSYLAWASDLDSNALFELALPNSEFDTWNTQITEAKEYIVTKDSSNLVFLPEIAKVREIDLETLCNKVIEKNKEFNKKLAKIIGYRQTLQKAVEQAQSPKEIFSYKYKFIFYKPNAKDLIEESVAFGTSIQELVKNVEAYGDKELIEDLANNLSTQG